MQFFQLLIILIIKRYRLEKYMNTLQHKQRKMIIQNNCTLFKSQSFVFMTFNSSSKLQRALLFVTRFIAYGSMTT